MSNLNQVLQDQFDLLDRFLKEPLPSVADLGAGAGHHTRRFLEAGLQVLAVDRVLTPELAETVTAYRDRCQFLRCDVASLPVPDGSLDAIWASHCLEHMENPMAALAEWRRVLKPQGRLAILVPPYESTVVGRHLFTGWNVGQLMLTLLRARFRVRDGVFARRGYNIFAVVAKCDDTPVFQSNDEILFQYHGEFPAAIEAEILARQFTNPFGETVGRFEGELQHINW